MNEKMLRSELSNAHAQIETLQRELEETNSGTMALTVELEESREALARQAEELRQANAELEAVNAELDAFAYSVSHDLRAPLRSILGFTDVLEEDFREVLGEEGRSSLHRVRNAAKRMNELVVGLLELSRAATSDFQRVALDLTAMSEQVVQTLREAAPDRDVSVGIDRGMRCEGEPRLLRIVLGNLLENAWKFTSPSESPAIRVGVEGRNGEDVFFVEDNGVGFDMRYAEQLFVPFQRMHTEDEFPGTGIGLATVRRIVRRHGGRIWAESEEGKGTRFSFTLGRRHSDEASASRPTEVQE